MSAGVRGGAPARVGRMTGGLDRSTLVVAGERVYIRTRRPVPLLDELRESGVEEGMEPPDDELTYYTFAAAIGSPFT